MSDEQRVYCGIEIAEFETGRDIPFDVYVRLSDDKYVKVATPATPLTGDRTAAYRAKDVTTLYITREDFARYLGLKAPDEARLSPEETASFNEMKSDADST